jgi:hypothetical protein
MAEDKGTAHHKFFRTKVFFLFSFGTYGSGCGCGPSDLLITDPDGDADPYQNL